MFTKIKQVIIVFSSGAILLTAAGCTGSASPATPPSSPSAATATGTPPSASQSPTRKPSPSPVPASSKGPAKNWPVPKMPDAAKKKSEAGIVAFAKYYFEIVDYTVLTYDTKPIKEFTERSCYLCSTQIIDPGDRNRGQGNWHVGGTTKLNVAFSKLTDSSGIAGFTFSRGKTSIYLPNGELQGEIPATKEASPGTLHLIYDKGWKVVDIEFVDIDGK